MCRRVTLQNGPARQAHCVQAMRDGSLEAGLTSDDWIGVDRHVIPADKAIQQGRLVRRMVRDTGARLRVGADRCDLARWRAVVAAAAVAAQELGRAQACQPFAAGLVEQLCVKIEQGAALWSLVLDGAYPMVGADGSVDGQSTMQREPLLAMQGLGPGDPRFGLSNPEGWPAARHAHAGYGPLIAALVNIGQFVLVQRIITDAEAERIQG